MSYKIIVYLMSYKINCLFIELQDKLFNELQNKLSI